MKYFLRSSAAVRQESEHLESYNYSIWALELLTQPADNLFLDPYKLTCVQRVLETSLLGAATYEVKHATYILISTRIGMFYSLQEHIESDTIVSVP